MTNGFLENLAAISGDKSLLPKFSAPAKNPVGDSPDAAGEPDETNEQEKAFAIGSSSFPLNEKAGSSFLDNLKNLSSRNNSPENNSFRNNPPQRFFDKPKFASDHEAEQFNSIAATTAAITGTSAMSPATGGAANNSNRFSAGIDETQTNFQDDLKAQRAEAKRKFDEARNNRNRPKKLETDDGSGSIIDKAYKTFFKQSGYKANTKGVLVEETFTHIASGNRYIPGLSEEEAIQFFEKWLDSYTVKNGNGILNNIGEFIDERETRSGLLKAFTEGGFERWNTSLQGSEGRQEPERNSRLYTPPNSESRSASGKREKPKIKDR